MKHENSNKYTIAWFKLAECVSRREKERALGVYRLLSHSIDDRALARQLEGDLLLSFRDGKAEQRYADAAELYKENGQLLQAAAVYEHLLTLNPSEYAYRKNAIQLYQALSLDKKVNEHVQTFICRVIETGAFKELRRYVDELKDMLEQSTYIGVLTAIAYTLIESKSAQEDTVKSYLKMAIDELNDSDLLQEFLNQLGPINTAYFDYALSYANEKK